MNDWAFAGIVVGTLVVTNLVGLLRGGSKTFRTYSADPKHHGPAAIAISLLGTIVGGGMFIGVGQIGYEAGVVGLILGAVYLVGMSLFGAFATKIAKAMEETKADTMLAVIEERFSRRMAIQFSVVCLVMYFFLLAAQFVALYSFAGHATASLGSQWIPWALVGLSGVSMLAYPVIGGLRKDISTDIVQLLIILGAAIIIGTRLFEPGVIQDTWSRLPATHLSGAGYGIVFLLGLILFLPASFFVRMDMWQRIGAARNPERIGKAFVAAGIGALLFYSLFTVVGMVARAQGLPSAETATLDLIQRQFSNPIVLGLIVGALFAAVLSSADTFVNNVSIFGARLAAPGSWIGELGETQDRRLLKFSRLAAAVSVLAAAGIALWSGDFVELLVGAFSLLLVYLPAIIGSLVERWRNERIAFWTSLTGVMLFIGLFIFWDKKLAFAPAVVLAIALYGLSLWVTARRNETAQQQHAADGASRRR